MLWCLWSCLARLAEYLNRREGKHAWLKQVSASRHVEVAFAWNHFGCSSSSVPATNFCKLNISQLLSFPTSSCIVSEHNNHIPFCYSHHLDSVPKFDFVRVREKVASSRLDQIYHSRIRGTHKQLLHIRHVYNSTERHHCPPKASNQIAVRSTTIRFKRFLGEQRRLG